jgi:predicted dehydrogenase
VLRRSTTEGATASALADEIASGSDLLVEEPAALTTAELERLAARARETGTIAVAGFHSRHAPAMRALCDAVRAGALGLPWGFHAEAARACSATPLGTAVDLLDAVAWATGAAPLETALLGDDPLVLACRLEHGIAGLVVAVHGPADGAVTVRITGSHGFADADVARGALHVSGAPAQHAEPASGRADTLAAFAARHDTNAHPLPDLGDAARLVRLVRKESQCDS